MNPEMCRELIELAYYKDLSGFKLFEHSEKSDIISIAMLMKEKLNVSEEQVIM